MRCRQAVFLAIVFFAAPLAAQGFTGTLGQIKKSGTIRIGYRESQPPMSFIDKDGKPAGYSIDVCACIADAARLADVRIRRIQDDILVSGYIMK